MKARRTILLFLLLAMAPLVGADVPVRPTAKRIAVFGGSFSVIAPSKVAKDAWCRRANAVYDDYGVGGAGFVAGGPGGTNAIPVQIDRALASGKDYDAFLLWASTNDCFAYREILAQQNESIAACVAKIRAARPAAKVLLMTSMPVPLRSESDRRRVEAYAAGQEETCVRLGVPVLAQHRLVAYPAERAADYFQADRLHPNEKGYDFVKDLQAAFLARQLGGPGGTRSVASEGGRVAQ